MKFLYCFDEEVKEKLLKNNYKFMCSKNINNTTAYVFLNDGNKLTFSNQEVVYTNKLLF